jgi:methionine-rich copper-binding protein CopC
VVLVSALIGLVAGAGVAAAHNVLISSNPADGSTVDKAPSAMVFTFDQPIQNIDPVLVVTGPNGNVFTDGPPTIDGNVISAPLGAAGPAGLYHAAYRIVSADGHPVTGEITFTLAGTAAGTATGSPPAAGAVPGAGSDSSSTSGSGGLSGWLWLGLGVAAVLVVVAVAIALRRPKDDAG